MTMTHDDSENKRPVGRPQKRPEDRRDKAMTVRWTPGELEVLEARAEAAGVSPAAFVRLSTLDAMGGG